jgi:ParB family chromosome partitioning protein
MSVNVTDTEETRMEICIKQIPLEAIDVPAGQRELGNLDGLMDSIQTVGLLNAIRVIPDGFKYRVIAGVRRYLAYKRLGWPTIPAIIEEMDDLHAELATIDENLIRQELTALEHAEQLARRKEIYEVLHPETKQGKGPGRGHREKKRNNFASFADDTASKTGYHPRTIQQAVQIATDLSDGVRERIRALPIAHKTHDLLRLSRLPQKTQVAIAHQLASGSAKSLLEAQRALNEDAEDRQSTSTRRPSPPVQTSAPRPTGWEPAREDRRTLLQTVIEHFQQSSAIIEAQIAGRPAADVMAERLAALPRPEVVLLAGLLTGPLHVAAEDWVAAVRAEGQDADHRSEGEMPYDYSGDSANDPEVPLTSIEDQDATLAGSVSAAHVSIRENARQGGKLTNAAVTAERGDDGADAEVQADGDPPRSPWGGEEQPPPPASHHHEEAVEPAADATRPIDDSVPADNGDSASVDVTRCGQCGGTQFLPTPRESGRIYCECGSVYNPSDGDWAPGRQERRKSPLAPLPATTA